MLIVAVQDGFVVVSKPTWMLTVPGQGEEKQDSVQTRMMRMFPHSGVCNIEDIFVIVTVVRLRL